MAYHDRAGPSRHRVLTIAETPTFTRQIRRLMEDEEYRLLQVALASKPDLGQLMPGAGGLRKMRWGLRGTGKRGGARIIYYWAVENDLILMLLAYAKGQQKDLKPDQLRILARLVKEEFK